MDAGVLRQLEESKLPAPAQHGVVVRRPRVVLVSRGGFSDGLRAAAEQGDRIRLVELDEILPDPAPVA